MQIEAIPFQCDINRLFSQFADEKHAVLFDSGKPEQQQGRYDIFSAWPIKQITILNNKITLHEDDQNDRIIHNLDKLKQLLSESWNSTNSDLPFCGGWIGFASYELGYILEPSCGQAKSHTLLPPFWAGYYCWAIIQDHLSKQAFLIYEDTIKPDLLLKIRQYLKKNLKKKSTVKPFKLTTNFKQKLEFSAYRTAFNKVQKYLQAGDCYQVNLAMQYYGKYQGSPFTAFTQLRKAVPSPHMAFLNYSAVDYSDVHSNKTKRQQILSISPERFISAKGANIQTRPIKGTAPRFLNIAEDRAASEKLALSPKNRAENLMIVDLLRNDLGHHCKPGSIKVDELFTIESYSNVHHLVSTISGEISPKYNIWDTFFSCFPGGSITGAPKIRACQIIAELEPQNREIYCGTLFYASNNGRFDSNISIRTLLCDQGDIYAWAGGGIVIDSTAEDEYQECQNKIGHLLSALEKNSTLLTTNNSSK